MIKLSAASAAALLLATVLAAPVYAYCDEDCAYERQEAAYERAYERSYQEDDDGYGRRSRGASQPSRRSARSVEQPAQKESKSRTRTVKGEQPDEEGKPAKRTQLGSRDGPVKNENSSIVEGSTQVAEDDAAPAPRKSNKALGCRTYLPSVGQTVSVPCD